MKWYSKYLKYYEKPLTEVPDDVVEMVKGMVDKHNIEDPKVSVVLIAHNEEKHLLPCLWSLCDNVCNYSYEIIVANNNSTDGTESVLQRLGVRYFNETKKGPGFARQCGLDHAKGEFHICIDSDTLYPPHYIATHMKALIKPNVVATYSLWSFIPNNGQSPFGLWIYESLRDLHLRIQAIKRPELCVRGMTFAFRTEYGRKYGFRTDIIRGEDGSLALNMKNDGQLVFITGRKARVMTGQGTLGHDGSLLNSFMIRLKKGLAGFFSLFTSKKEYKDEDSNLIK
jgi:glycosyltransferase involved in cell wall biosynthesis